MGSRIENLSAPGHTLRALLAEGGAQLRSMIKSLQHARMMAILCEMSDAELAVQGITRDEIPAHAAALVGVERP